MRVLCSRAGRGGGFIIVGREFFATTAKLLMKCEEPRRVDGSVMVYIMRVAARVCDIQYKLGREVMGEKRVFVYIKRIINV